MAKKAAGASATLTAYALSLPGAELDHPWGENVAKVGGKVFVFLGRDGGDTWGVSVKLPQSQGAALTLPFTEPTGYGLGKAGWVTASFAAGKPGPVALLQAWILESYTAVAPKRRAGGQGSRGKPGGRK